MRAHTVNQQRPSAQAQRAQHQITRTIGKHQRAQEPLGLNRVPCGRVDRRPFGLHCFLKGRERKKISAASLT